MAALALAGCDSRSGSDGMPMAQPSAFDQPAPRAPVLADSNPVPTPHLETQHASSQPLPAAVPLPPRPVIQSSGGAQDSNQANGGSSPAAGYASGITDARGDGDRHELDGGKNSGSGASRQ
ncbi:hypothetical protein [Comamonas endophytica]|uniref:Lipoprotein n=1 Tax=Comamonas endophytica TaxID=2949090 RepID=A0ABY6G6V9_9BURK|nr:MULTISPECIES: hypothetical protein [unclassified Acidovorax]MCD2512357.1 hypothetical protein [Acidovorax sp. D4N7]UYG50194.1 hypothetical protein M9799_08665 [Acidovorax sp. 5MLIR]